MANRGCNTCANNAGLEHVLHCWVALLVFLLWLPAAAASTTRLEQQGSFPLNFDTSLYYMGVDGLVPRDASMPHASKRRELKQQAIGGGGAKISTQPAEEFDPFAPQIPVNLTSLLAPEEKIDIWLLLGQSNMVGDNAMDVQPMPPDSQPIPGKAFAWSFAQQFWTTAIPNVCMRSHGYDLSPYVTQSAGPEFAFARVLLGMGVTNRIGFMPAAMNGQSLSIDYQPGEGHYNDVIRNTRDAMAAIGKQAVLRGALWVQGETEATAENGPTQASQYGATFTTFLAALRQDLAGLYEDRLPVVMGVMQPNSRASYLPFIGVVRAQQLALRLPDLLKVDMQAIEFFSQYWSEEAGYIWLHASKLGQVAMGQLMALSYMQWAGTQCKTAGTDSSTDHSHSTGSMLSGLSPLQQATPSPSPLPPPPSPSPPATFVPLLSQPIPTPVAGPAPTITPSTSPYASTPSQQPNPTPCPTLSVHPLAEPVTDRTTACPLCPACPACAACPTPPVDPCLTHAFPTLSPSSTTTPRPTSAPAIHSCPPPVVCPTSTPAQILTSTLTATLMPTSNITTTHRPTPAAILPSPTPQPTFVASPPAPSRFAAPSPTPTPIPKPGRTSSAPTTAPIPQQTAPATTSPPAQFSSPTPLASPVVPHPLPSTAAPDRTLEQPPVPIPVPGASIHRPPAARRPSLPRPPRPSRPTIRTPSLPPLPVSLPHMRPAPRARLPPPRTRRPPPAPRKRAVGLSD